MQQFTSAPECDVLVYGQTTAALAAALGAAGAHGAGAPALEQASVCFLEPTDWPGGQLTSQGLSAVDFPHHGPIREMRSRHNLNSVFASWMGFNDKNVIEGSNPGGCSVSVYCNTPAHFLGKIEAELARKSKYPKLRVLKNTVVVGVKTQGAGEATRIVSVTARTRRAIAGNGWTKPLSEQMPQWYGPVPGAREDLFTYDTFEIPLGRTPGRAPIVIDASETGDILVLSGGAWVQGAERTRNAYSDQIENHGQALVFPFAQRLGGGVQPNVSVPPQSSAFYSFGAKSGNDIFNYRKIGAGLTIQNWNPGNDFAFRYLFLSRAETDAQRPLWRGGVDFGAIAGAEAHALGWHTYFRNKSGLAVGIDTATMGTANGLSKFPYLRDTRRSVGLDGFFIRDEAIWRQPGSTKGAQFDDSLGIGLYVVDVHSVRNGIPAPSYLNEKILDTAVFTLPFRAHTNKTVANLLVAGKSMAQTYYVNAATRLQPIEFVSGWGAGVAAQHMWRWELSSRQVVDSIVPGGFDGRTVNKAMQEIQYKITNTQPIWFCRAAGWLSDCLSKTPDGQPGRFLMKKPSP